MDEAPVFRPKGRTVPLSEAVGTVLAHDVTEIRPGQFKGVALKKGHVIRESDLEHLARLGKQNLFILDIPEGMVHEDEAVLTLAPALAGPGAVFSPKPSEGKINLTAEYDGLLKVNVEALTEFNMVEGIMCAGRHSNSIVKKGEILAGARAIPLVVPAESVQKAAAAARDAGGVFTVKKMSRPLTGLLVTGNEIYEGLIEDRSAQIVVPKLEELGCRVLRVEYAPDDEKKIAEAVSGFIRDGAGLVIATGGMSVDPDDVTRLGIMAAGAENVLYGSSVLPGAMLLVSNIGTVPVLGVPACVIYHPRTIFDVVLPRVLAGEILTRRDLAALSHGGLCLNCESCRYPICPFGKGG